MAKGRVLAVDDQRYFRELITGLLTHEGYEVIAVGSGEEAVAALERERFDVVVTDLVMPGMNGTDLVRRIKATDPEQDVVVVTGVVDVRSAVDAMKLGASEYLLKPFDRDALAAALDSILQRRRLHTERDRLLAENIEYMAERSLFARALSMFSTLSIEPLAEKILESLAGELDADGAALWLASDTQLDVLVLAAVHGLVRGSDEPEQIALAHLPKPLREGATTCSGEVGAGPDEAARHVLWVVLRSAGRAVGLARVSDKRGGASFDEVDRGCAERLASFAEVALRNAWHLRDALRRAQQDPATGAHRIELLQDVVHREIERSARFGRSFSVARMRAQKDGEASARAAARDALVSSLRTRLRAADLLALSPDGSVLVLLAETDALGAATFKRRVREWAQAVPAKVHIGVASCPSDATDWPSLARRLDQRLARDETASAWERCLAESGIAAVLGGMLGEGQCEPPETAAALARFALSEVGRNPRERNLFFFHPGAPLASALAAFDARRTSEGATEVVVVAPPAGRAPEGRVAWIAPEQLPGCPPFAIHYGDGAPYALVCAERPERAGLRLYHTNDRETVEALAFRLQRDLRLPTLG
jgi:two-component system, cell cycle response regulator